MPLKREHEPHVAALQKHLSQVVSATGLKPGEVVREVLARSVVPFVGPNIAFCEVEQRPGSEYVTVTFAPIPGAEELRGYKYRNPNNAALVDDQGRWTGVWAYFREWEGMIGEAVLHVNKRRVHATAL